MILLTLNEVKADALLHAARSQYAEAQLHPAGQLLRHPFSHFWSTGNVSLLSTHEYTPPPRRWSTTLKMTEVIGTQRGVVVQPSVHGLDNAATLDAIANSGGRFRGVGRIDDKTPKSGTAKIA